MGLKWSLPCPTPVAWAASRRRLGARCNWHRCQRVRELTRQPFCINMFVLATPSPDAGAVQRGLDLLAPFRAELGLPQGRRLGGHSRRPRRRASIPCWPRRCKPTSTPCCAASRISRQALAGAVPRNAGGGRRHRDQIAADRASRRHHRRDRHAEGERTRPARRPDQCRRRRHREYRAAAGHRSSDRPRHRPAHRRQRLVRRKGSARSTG